MTQELRRLAEAATQGPWIAGDDEDSDYFLVGPHDGDEIVFQPVVKLHAQNNAEYIAAANPAAILSLLDRLEKAEKDAARLEYVYSGKKTNSNALALIEMRFINDDIPTMDEVRTAIDSAMEASK